MSSGLQTIRLTWPAFISSPTLSLWRANKYNSSFTNPPQFTIERHLPTYILFYSAMKISQKYVISIPAMENCPIKRTFYRSHDYVLSSGINFRQVKLRDKWIRHNCKNQGILRIIWQMQSCGSTKSLDISGAKIENIPNTWRQMLLMRTFNGILTGHVRRISGWRGLSPQPQKWSSDS